MDLMNIAPKTQRVEIYHPGTGRNTGLVIEVTSAESDNVKSVERRHNDKVLRNRKKMTAADFEANAKERLAACVVGWDWQGDYSVNGEKLELTKENIAKVLDVPWVRSQVQEVVADEAGFFSS